jgi:CRISPR type I-E-associated protein CasB/Cse2
MLADLRHGFSETTRLRAWPHLLGPPVNCRWSNEEQEIIWVTVAAICATVGYTGQKYGNIGRSIRDLAYAGKDPGASSGDDVLKSMEPRFKRLLASGSATELCSFLPGIAKRCSRDNVPVDVKCLFWDLAKWNEDQDERRIAWAQSFWHAPKVEREEAGA